MSACPTCGTATQADQNFCANCGTALALRCMACSTEYQPGDNFCRRCGAALAASASVPAHIPSPAGPAAERRLVSVLFVDLVGFTTLSESRDAEDIRALLER